jgi:hypothetical protein
MICAPAATRCVATTLPVPSSTRNRPACGARRGSTSVSGPAQNIAAFDTATPVLIGEGVEVFATVRIHHQSEATCA